MKNLDDVFEVATIGEIDTIDRRHLVDLALKQIGKSEYRGLIVCSTKEGLAQMMHLCNAQFKDVRESKHSRFGPTWTFDSGATIWLRKLTTKDDAFRHAAREFQFIGFDKPSHEMKFVYEYLITRCRTIRLDLECSIRSVIDIQESAAHWAKTRFVDLCDGPGKVAYFLSGPNPVTQQWETVRVEAGTKYAWSRAFQEAGA